MEKMLYITNFKLSWATKNISFYKVTIEAGFQQLQSWTTSNYILMLSEGKEYV